MGKPRNSSKDPKSANKPNMNPQSKGVSRKNFPNSSKSNFFLKSKHRKGPFPTSDKQPGNSSVSETSSSNSSFFLKSKHRKGPPPISDVQPGDSGASETVQKGGEKKPFDKKLYRLKKYSNKYKLQQWEDNRKKAVLRDFYKIKSPKESIDVNTIYNDPRYKDSDEELDGESEQITNQNVAVTKPEETESTLKREPQKKYNPIQRARDQFQRIKEEKQKKREEFLKKKQEKEEALKKYRKEKAVKFKKLSRKTKKGQPIMKDRLEMLLEKIQQMT